MALLCHCVRTEGTRNHDGQYVECQGMDMPPSLSAALTFNIPGQ